ncbi:hypothetical protein HZH68_010677 [Vespula germanica]|uniref:Uncharacterized protein n=1 Tax=Vespula germanica TaxID=30212 RepID=A0A834N4C3_VESGE|nr:hypothetical protein HZH68_010677 [Vespula germanica]
MFTHEKSSSRKVRGCLNGIINDAIHRLNYHERWKNLKFMLDLKTIPFTLKKEAGSTWVKEKFVDLTMQRRYLTKAHKIRRVTRVSERSA